MLEIVVVDGEEVVTTESIKHRVSSLGRKSHKEDCVSIALLFGDAFLFHDTTGLNGE